MSWVGQNHDVCLNAHGRLPGTLWYNNIHCANIVPLALAEQRTLLNYKFTVSIDSRGETPSSHLCFHLPLNDIHHACTLVKKQVIIICPILICTYPWFDNAIVAILCWFFCAYDHYRQSFEKQQKLPAFGIQVLFWKKLHLKWWRSLEKRYIWGLSYNFFHRF